MPERSFFFKGSQFPVCARCTGVILGEVMALICLLFSMDVTILIALALLIPMGIDWGLQYVKILKSSNIRRLITGTLGGFGLTFCYANTIMLIWHWLFSWFTGAPKGFLVWMLIFVAFVGASVIALRIWHKSKQRKSTENFD